MRAVAWAVALALSGVLLHASAAHARVERFAVIIGNNHGASSEVQLRYAESDAAKVYDVLREIGDFEPLNMILLRGENVDTARGALIAFNDRIRQAQEQPDTRVMLLVYYSGHADAERLHLGGTDFKMTELAQLVRGSAASFRLVILDACRSGALTRLKGGRVLPAFALQEETLAGDGLAFLTAAAAHEDAQESDEIQGSFFTHALLSGLLGAADRDRDGRVVLDEAYRYAYESTLRDTSRTFAGTQHATFRYDFSGRGDFVLTQPGAHAHERATLYFPTALAFLLLREGADGSVVAELGDRAPTRALSVPAGRYFVRARAKDVMYEGALVAGAGSTYTVRLDDMRRIEYARLVRKGVSGRANAQGIEAGMRLRSALPNESVPCFGVFAGYALDFERFGIAARLSACRSSFRSETLSAEIQAYDVEGRFYHAWDIGRLTVDAGFGLGTSLFMQHFETSGRAPARTSFAPFTSLRIAATADLGAGIYAGLDLSTESHFLSLQVQSKQPGLVVEFAVRSALSLGKRF